MFSGIVMGRGTVTDCRRAASGACLSIAAPSVITGRTSVGDSVSVAGVCLTVTGLGDGQFSADVSAETLAHTTLGRLERGHAVNLEPALRLADALGGHLVTGHVDGTARLVSRVPDGQAERLSFRVPAGLERYLARKGSVCIDGVSLTVNSVARDVFDVCIIPHTLEVTTLGALSEGDAVNIEVDLIARYLERLLPPAAEQRA